MCEEVVFAYAGLLNLDITDILGKMIIHCVGCDGYSSCGV